MAGGAGPRGLVTTTIHRYRRICKGAIVAPSS
nr:MAG TPA: hypothetical protein [Caudoviricetes sp.]